VRPRPSSFPFRHPDRRNGIVLAGQLNNILGHTPKMGTNLTANLQQYCSPPG
jgi:hypothetical protein